MNVGDIQRWHRHLDLACLNPTLICPVCYSHLQDSALNPEHDITPPIDRGAAIKYELAGRGDTGQTFKDFRSPAKARRRHRERQQKYYHWRGVKPGQLGRLHYVDNNKNPRWYDVPLQDAPVTVMTKKQLFREAQDFPRPPTWRRSMWWGKAPWGTNHKPYGPKNARWRLEEDTDEAMGAEFQYFATGDDSRFQCTWESVGTMFLFGMDALNSNEDCGCRCDSCHRECNEQKRRERNGELDLAEEDEASSLDETWDVLSAPSLSLESDNNWDFADSTEGSDDQGWIMAGNDSTSDLQQPTKASSSPPFPMDEDFDKDGYLPYTETHLRSDLATGRCRACVADYVTRTRREHYAHARLGDIAFLNGIVPIGGLAEDWYRMMEPTWWSDARRHPGWEREDHWMLEIGCE